MENKYWCFLLDHPVDISIACEYVAKHFSDFIGETPAECWSWFNKTAECQLHYSNRTPIRKIVFDTVNKTWLIRCNVNPSVVNRANKVLKADSYWSWDEIASYHGRVRQILTFEELYENHMEEARSTCTIPKDTISRTKRLLDLELIIHNQEVARIRQIEAEQAREYHRSRHTNYNGELLPFYKKYGY